MRLLSDRRFLIACLLGAMPFILVAFFTEARGWAVTAFIVLGALVAFGVSTSDSNRPTLEDTEQFLLGLLARHGFSGAARLDGIAHRVTSSSAPDCVSVNFRATVTITETLYQTTVPSTEVCGGFTPRRIVTLGNIAARIAGDSEGVPGIALPAPPQDPYSRQFVQARSQPGWTLPVSGTARATHSARDGWHYHLTLAPRELELLAQTGRPREAFHDAVALDGNDGLQWLREIVQAWQKYESDLNAARTAIDQHRAQRGHQAVASFFATHRAGSCFEGTGETMTQRIAPLSFWLELTALDAAQNLVQFALRPSCTSPHARHFTATVEHASDTGIVRLMASTGASDAAPHGGPLLNAAAAFTMEFLWEVNGVARLKGHGADFVLTLREARSDALAGLRALGLEREREIWNAIAPGTKYTGTFVTQGSERELELVFLPGAQPGHLVAQLDSEGSSEVVNVTRISGKSAGSEHDLVLEPMAVDVPAPVGAEADANAEAWQRMHLRVQGQELQGVIASDVGEMPVTLRR